MKKKYGNKHKIVEVDAHTRISILPLHVLQIIMKDQQGPAPQCKICLNFNERLKYHLLTGTYYDI